ncbi:PREDICTED: E3 ubiquitin-protein ligase TRIM71-like [Branchiostoma belcheri]|uniref:E3 ubiquitin-protein ligase TRIM71-like n=1 Tax=Branchiostoma belcheri TaxID=7741 RepID=A0A6P4YXS0_BRABE|nr:PREDICTED: E3 ubiquitin-protein ligase TRIM71-like [Branchiostoma belcheri]
MVTKVQKVNRDRGGELTREKEKLVTELEKNKEGVKLCEKILDCKDDTQSLILRKEMEEKFQKLALEETGKNSLVGHTKVSFHPRSLSQVSGGSLSVFAGFTIDVQEPAVESLSCPVTVTTNNADLTGGKVAPQIEVTSPQGKTTLIQTRAHTSPPLAAGKGQTSRVSRVWGAEWRPQQSGKHTLGVCIGGMKDLCSLNVDVGSNNHVLRLGQKGSQQGQFDTPIDVAVSGDRLYVADTYNQRVQVFDLSGKFCHSFAVNPGPYGLAVQRDGRVVVADKGKHSIFLFEADGTLVKQVGGQGKGEGQFDQPYFVCVDKEDNVIVADKNNHRVQVFDRNLNYKHKFGQWGRLPQDMFGPAGVSADSRGNIVLANFGDVSGVSGVEHGRKLQVFRPDGTWVSTISSDGDKLNWPHGVAVTEDGHVFVVDPEDHCVRKYRYM